jgi:acyl-CoA-binding protein
MVTANASNGVVANLKTPTGISSGRFQAEKAAIESGDFASWKAYIESGPEAKLLDTINADNFDRYVQAFKLREAGDFQGAMTIMRELGLSDVGRPEQMFSDADAANLKQAIEQADYEAWETLMAKIDAKKTEGYLTQENFNVIVRAYKLQASGDVSGAKALLKNSKIPGWLFSVDKAGRDFHQADEGVRAENEQALLDAYSAKDYEAWKNLMSGRGGMILEVINADNFAKFAEAKLLQHDGKDAEAKTILDGLGLPFHGRGMRMNGTDSTDSGK